MKQQLCHFALSSWAGGSCQDLWRKAGLAVYRSVSDRWRGNVRLGEFGLTGVFTISEKIRFCPLFPDEMWVRCPGDLSATETEDWL